MSKSCSRVSNDGGDWATERGLQVNNQKKYNIPDKAFHSKREQYEHQILKTNKKQILRKIFVKMPFLLSHCESQSTVIKCGQKYYADKGKFSRIHSTFMLRIRTVTFITWNVPKLYLTCAHDLYFLFLDKVLITSVPFSSSFHTLFNMD